MSVNCLANPCPIIVNSSCVFYQGPNLICLGVNTNDTIENALIKINAVICDVAGLDGTSGTSGTSGSSGTSGINGTSGSSGTAGTSGSTGNNGSSGTTGTSGSSGDRYRTTSETCFTLGDAGTIFVEPGLAYTPAQAIVISVDESNYQVCIVISYNNVTGELVFDTPSVVVGTPAEYCQWDVNLNGASGGDGSNGTSGTSGSSGVSCLSANIVNTDSVEQIHVIYVSCDGTYNDYYADPGYDQDVCYQTGTLDVTSAGTFEINQQGICYGTSGTSGTSGAPGDAICPDHVKLASVSGVITTSSYNTPILDDLFIGNNPLGYSYGLYGVQPDFDGFGNITAIKGINTNCGIILPVDLNEQDTVKISGIAYMPDRDETIDNPVFYITVSYFNCTDVSLDKIKTPTFTVIPVAAYSIPGKEWKVCFSESISLANVLAADETFFVVGVGAGSDSGDPFDVRFTYSLDVSQACIGGGKNLLIRNCCDPAYSEIIINNLVPVGESFVDIEGNCWTVDSETENAITGSRELDTQYADCDACIATNPCPDNFDIQSCCGGEGQIFTAALPGVNVGDTFVDTNGFCWSAISETGAPITNVVQVGTIYTATDCDSAVCVEANTCPTSVLLISCCFEGWSGYTTLELLQATLPSLVINDVFVDTFGTCWRIIGWDSVVFPNMSFIIPDTDYGDTKPACLACTEANGNCANTPLYYTVQNCCTEEIEVILLDPGYSVGNILILIHTTGAGCYKVLSWNSVGIPTITVVSVEGIDKNCEVCLKNIAEKTGGTTCIGDRQCCTSWTNISIKIGASIFVTGYTCDGTWVVDYELFAGSANSICLSQLWNTNGDGQIEKDDQCCFDAYNPSLTEDISLSVNSCNGFSGEVILPPQTLLSDIILNCASCVIRQQGPAWEYAECPELSDSWSFTESAFKAWPVDTDGYTLYTDGFSDVDDGQTNSPIYNDTLGGSQIFYFAGGSGYNNFNVYTNGWIQNQDGYPIYGNNGDLYLNPGASLSDGTTQNLWYRTIGNPDKWQTSILVYCGECCGSPSEQTPYSYILNLYRDGSVNQFIETFVKSNVGGTVGPAGYTNTPSTTSQVWRSNDDGNSWTYLGYGSVE